MKIINSYPLSKYKGFFNSIDIIKRKIKLFLGNYYYFIAKCRGVIFLGPCKFIGRPRFKLYPRTKIIIGSNCEFLSGHTDNLIGINHPCIISAFNAATEIHIGENSGFSGTIISAFIGITIGKNVKCGANTLISDSDWHPEDPRSGKPSPIVIGDNVWLGVNSVILKGVKIGENTVIGANSVVTKNIPPNVIAAGNPCKVIKQI